MAKSTPRKVAPSLKNLLEAALPEEKTAIWLKACKSVQVGPQIKHVFTHRRLWMQIWDVNALKSVEPESANLQWVPLSQLGRYGLPQPIKILLQGLSLARDDGLKN